jgi:RTX calcium-binding nonapeptide repeat (4 copies)
MLFISNYLYSTVEICRFDWKNREYWSRHSAPVEPMPAALAAKSTLLVAKQGDRSNAAKIEHFNPAAAQAGAGSGSVQDSNASSNAWSVNLKDGGEPANTFKGDQRAKRIGIEVDLGTSPTAANFGTYKWSATSWAEDGTLNEGLEEADFNDVIRGKAGIDKIDGLGGNDALDGGADVIAGGTEGDLLIGGAGEDKNRGAFDLGCFYKRSKLFNTREGNLPIRPEKSRKLGRKHLKLRVGSIFSKMKAAP